MMRKILFCLSLLIICDTASAIEIVREKNAATYITFPIIDVNGDIVSSAAALDSELDAFADGSAPDGFVDCTNEATEVSTTGIYYLSLTATEMNNDYVYIQVKTTTTDAKTQHILIRTLTGDPLNIATTTSGRELDVASTGEAGVDFSNVNGTLDAPEIGTDAIGAAEVATDAIGSSEFAQAAADLVWSTTTRALTDKAGFSISGTKTTLDALNDISTAEVNTEADAALSDINLHQLVIASGSVETSGSNSTTQVQTNLAEATNDHYNGMVILLTSSTEAGQARLVSDYVGATGVISWLQATTATPPDASTFVILPSSQINLLAATQASIDAIEADTNEIQGKLPTNNLMGSSDLDNHDTDIDSILIDTNSLNDTKIPDTISLANINAEVDAGLVDINLDHLLKVALANTDVIDDSLFARLVSKSATADWDDYVNTTDSLQALRDRGDSAWITATGFSTHSAADVWTSGTRTITGLTAAALADFFDTDSLTTYGSAVAGSVVKEIADNAGGGTPPTAAAIADQVWEELIADHSSTSGSTAEALNAAGSAGDPWVTALPGSYTSGQAGGILASVKDSTDGDKESGSYTGVEKLIRRHGR